MSQSIFLKWNLTEEGKQLAAKTSELKTSVKKSSQITKEVPLIDPPVLELSSQFSSFGDMVPQISRIINLANQVGSAADSSASRSTINLANQLDLPKWQKTNPLKFQTTLRFFTETNPLADVIIPVKDLASLSVLSTGKEKDEFIVPGINLRTLAKKDNQGGTKGKVTSLSQEESEIIKTQSKKLLKGGSKSLTIYIPGVLYIPEALVERAVPTFSPEITEQGYPLWGTIDLTIQDLYPASSGRLYQVPKGGKTARESLNSSKGDNKIGGTTKVGGSAAAGARAGVTG
jgi:hypothetical protein